MTTSRTMRSGKFSRARVTPCSPSGAVTTRYPAVARQRCSSSRSMTSSSMTRTRWLISGPSGAAPRIWRSALLFVEEGERGAVVDHGHEGRVHRRINDGAHQVAEPGDRHLGGHLFLIGPRRGQGIVDLDRADDPGTERY